VIKAQLPGFKVESLHARRKEAAAAVADNTGRIDLIEAWAVHASEHPGRDAGVPEEARIDEKEVGAAPGKLGGVARQVQVGMPRADENNALRRGAHDSGGAGSAGSDG